MKTFTISDFEDLQKRILKCELEGIIDGLEQSGKYLICTQRVYDIVFPDIAKSENVRIVHPYMLPNDAIYIMDKEPPILPCTIE